VLAPALALLLVLPACTSDEPAEPGGSSSTGDAASTSTSAASSTSVTPTTTAPPPETTAVDDTTTFGAGCGPDPCPEQCGPDCESTATCLASEWMCTCDCPMTGTEGTGCPTLPDTVDAWVEPSLSPAIDCGTVGPDDDATAWQTVHDCVVLSAEGTAFRATWTQPEGRAPIEFGAAGRVVEGYALGWFERTGEVLLVRDVCTALPPLPDCVVEPGQMCLTCVDPVEDEVVCAGP